MDIYDVPNIEHCDVSNIGTMGWRVIAHEGWYIHKSTDPDSVDENGNVKKLYFTIALIRTTEDLSGVEIVAEADLPDNAEICGGTGDTDHEIS